MLKKKNMEDKGDEVGAPETVVKNWEEKLGDRRKNGEHLDHSSVKIS